MKITPYSTVAFAFVMCAMFATSCANDVETDINIDPVGNAISFSPSVGHTSRATETKIGNLGDFAVVARGMHHDGVLYDAYLIGSENAGEIAKRESLDSEDKGIWKLSRKVYWPSTLNKVLFFAYTALKQSDTYTDSNVLGIYADGTKPSFGFVGDMPFINSYKPLKATQIENNIKADGKNQRDLLVAYTQQEKKQSETNVTLNFEHALTQVSITAMQENKTDNRIVKIKGAWIVNVAESGNLTTTETKDKTDFTITYSKSWVGSGKTAYGTVWSDEIKLDGSTAKDILRQHSLMLIPEDLKAWDFEKAWDSENDKENTTDNGAYIMLLCRVELEHDGATHEGNTNIEDIYVDEANSKHYHQLFPVNVNTFDATEYGFACVPLSSVWNTDGIGKHYTYKLNICGNGTGAGKYPPTMTSDEINALVPPELGIKVVTNNNKVTGKHPGDNVLDEPIQFTVTVEGWTEQENWTNGVGSI